MLVGWQEIFYGKVARALSWMISLSYPKRRLDITGNGDLSLN